MNFFSILWMRVKVLFRAADLKPLDPVIAPLPSEEHEEALALAAALRPETVSVDVPLFKAVEVPSTKPKRRKKQLTRNFHIDEFACHDGTAVPPELYSNVLELAKNLQILRDQLEKPIKIMSGYRHIEYNKKIGGATKSQHLTAKAADIKVKGVSPEKMASIISVAMENGAIKKGGLGKYPTFTHYDIRGKRATWNGTRKKN